MSKVFAISSSKGGVGKTTICNHLARSMANFGNKTILIETDSGLRGLDILLNISNIIYDVYDVVCQRCNLNDAIQISSSNSNLALLPAPFNFESKIELEDIEKICKKLKQSYDNIVIDLNTNIYLVSPLIKFVDFFIIITTPDPVCVRDVAIYVNFLKNEIENLNKLKLIVNKMQKKLIRKNILKNLDEIIDEIGLQLIGVIPQSNKLEIANFCGKNLHKNSLVYKIFDAINQRLNDYHRKLLIK